MKFYILLYAKLRTYNCNISNENYLPLFQHVNEGLEIFFLTYASHQKTHFFNPFLDVGFPNDISFNPE